MNRRYAIINADDFGQSPGANRGVIQAHELGVLTSTSLMVRWPAAEEAAGYARRRPELGVGLHLDFGEWAYRDGDWVRLYGVVDETDTHAVAAEVQSQMAAFERLVGRRPTHIDSHQHRHRHEPAESIVRDIARRLEIPVRDISVPYCGKFYGQDERGVSHPEWITAAAFIEILSGLGGGPVEIGCHPAAADDLDTMYRAERLIELETLCDARVRGAIEELGIELRSFGNWRSDHGRDLLA